MTSLLTLQEPLSFTIYCGNFVIRTLYIEMEGVFYV